MSDLVEDYIHTEFLQQLVIELTTACNQNCIFCGRTYMSRYKSHMNKNIFNKIVEEVAEESPFVLFLKKFSSSS